MKKTILITGWAWYIWSHAVVVFEQSWYNTIILDNFSNSDEKNLKWIDKILWYSPKFFNCDLKNFWDVEKIFLEQENKWEKIDWVLHFAWLKAVWESCESSIKYFENNISWSINLFSCMEKFLVKNLIFSSSATVYNEENFEKQNFSWVKENSPVWNTSNPYWTTKYLLEKILEDLSKFSNFNVINLRYFNPIWAHKSWFIWEDPKWIPNNLLPYIMKVAKWELEFLNIFWDNYNTIDWTWVRDYIDVNDLINGHLLAYKKLSPCHSLEGGNLLSSWFFETYNLWTWKWISVLEIIKIAEDVTWKKINYKIWNRRDGDLANVFCNPEKARCNLQWNSKINLDTSLKTSWNFTINN